MTRVQGGDLQLSIDDCQLSGAKAGIAEWGLKDSHWSMDKGSVGSVDSNSRFKIQAAGTVYRRCTNAQWPIIRGSQAAKVLSVGIFSMENPADGYNP